MNKAIIFVICLAFVSISGYSMNCPTSENTFLIPGKSKSEPKEFKKKKVAMKLRMPSGQLKKGFLVF
jgi:hypothetical protein